MLELEQLHGHYGKSHVLQGISLHIGAGELVSLLGRNGAGKTTTLKCIAGVVRPSGGRVRFAGHEVQGLAPHRIARRGVCLVPEHRGVFKLLSVEENLLLGAFARKDPSGVRADLDAAYALFPILGERRKQPAGTFSGGEQQMLAMGRAMMSRPKLLMLDEPSMGLSPIMMKRIMSTVTELQQQGTTILLVEQNAQAALKRADYGYVLEVGKIVVSGSGRDLLVNDDVRKAYLGED